jgi:pantoate--beta-alanine ligase
MLSYMKTPEIVTSAAELRARVKDWRRTRRRVVLVPTMGALHDGHLALTAATRTRTARTVVSIFVNPAQFAPHEDFDRYPRNLETDFRPHFFTGVATIVAKLLLAVMPDAATFGEKDNQQLLVVRRLAADLGLATKIVGASIVREPDGLAMSSRNAYLTQDGRRVAGQMNAVLKRAIAELRKGTSIPAAEDSGKRGLLQAGFDSIDYVAVRDAETLAPLESLDRPARLLAAAKVGETRLIDNMAV